MKSEYPKITVERKPTVNGKPIYEITVHEIINFESAFEHKLLCDGPTFSLGSACVFNCSFCYVESIVRKHPEVVKLSKEWKARGLTFEDVVVVRCDALEILREQLTLRSSPRMDLLKKRVIFSSPLVDPAPTIEMAKQTAAACWIILKLTNWDIRLLSKSSLLRIVAEAIPERFKHRLIYGFSTGTLDDHMAKSFEQGTALVRKRIESLHWLQDNGFRTYGMICPNLPQEDYDKFAAKMAAAIRVERCEHVWAEALNVRGDAMERTCADLERGGYNEDAARVRAVSKQKNSPEWEQYSRETFLAHTHYITPDKLRYLQYVNPETVGWWKQHRSQGAVLLGAAAGH